MMDVAPRLRGGDDLLSVRERSAAEPYRQEIGHRAVPAIVGTVVIIATRPRSRFPVGVLLRRPDRLFGRTLRLFRSEEHTSELQSLMRNTYAVFCLKKKN